MLERTISKVLGDQVTIVNSAREVARAVKDRLIKDSIENSKDGKPTYTFYTSDSVEKFRELGELFLGKDMKSVHKTDIELYANNLGKTIKKKVLSAFEDA